MSTENTVLEGEYRVTSLPTGHVIKQLETTALDVPTLDDAKRNRIAAIRDHFEAVVAGIKADAAPYELDSWPIQRAEYVAWLMDPASPTPYVSGLAAGRGITLQDLMGKIGTKVAGISTIQGTQHRLEKLVEAATSIAEVEAVTW